MTQLSSVTPSVSSDPVTIETGTRLDRYEILSKLATGGMADVWLAQWRGVGGVQKEVVIKTMLPDLVSSPHFLQMFVNEASLIAQINHPNVVSVFDFGECDGQYFMAMEYVEGRTLRQINHRMRELGRALPTWALLRVLIDVCAGLQHAHDLTDPGGAPLGIVHRDMSPENIMVAFTGTVKVLDFGVALATCVEETGPRSGVVGKYGYLAPERLTGSSGERRGDVYALGVILYELLTGVRPFSNDETTALDDILAARFFSPQDLAPELPDELARITLKAMARDAGDRYPEARALAEDLTRFLRANEPADIEPLGSFVQSLFRDPAELSGCIVKRRLSENPTRPTDLSRFLDPDLLTPHTPPVLDAVDVDVDVDAQWPVPPPPPSGGSVLDRLARGELRAEPPKSTPSTSGSIFDVPPPSRPRPELVHVADAFVPRRKEPGVSRDVFDASRRTGAGGPGDETRRAMFADPSRERTGVRENLDAARRFERGLAFVREQDFEAARSEWERAVELEPENRTYQHNLKRLRERMGVPKP